MLISDDEAEHIPGCNMAFRRDVLDASEGSTRSSGPPATTSTCAGGRTTPACGSASSPRRWSGTTAATPFAAIWRSSEGTARRRACSSASGPRTTARPAIRCGGVGFTERGSAEHHGQRRWRCLRHLGIEPLPVDLPAGRSGAAGAAAHARVLPADRRAPGSVGGRAAVDLVAGGRAAARARGGRLLLDAGLGARRAAEVRRGPSPFARLRMSGLVAALHPPAAGSAVRTGCAWGLTPFRRRGPGGLLAPRPRTVATWERTVDTGRDAAGGHRGPAPPQRGDRPPWQ